MDQEIRIAVVLSPDSLRRLAQGFGHFKRPGINFWLVDYRRPVRAITALIKKWNVNGIITEAIEVPRLTSQLCALGIPTVLGPADAPRAGAGCVAVDDVSVGMRAADHFMNLGLRQFAYLGESHRLFSRLRLKGYSAALEKSGFACRIFDLKNNPKYPKRALEYWDLADSGLNEWLRTQPRPVGLFVAHDALSRMPIAACVHQNIRIPDDVAVLGVDNDEIVCALSHVPLSSVRIPWDQIGYQMAALLESMIGGKAPPEKSILFEPVGIIQRQSTHIEAVGDPIVSQALQFIRKNIHRPIDVTDVVRAACVSRRDLERRFRKVLLRTPKDQIDRSRVEQAGKFLTEMDLPMPEIAKKVGLNYPERLAILFRRELSITPAEYRRKFRNRV